MIVKSDLTDILLKATLKANRTYEKISGSWLSDYGVEGFMAANLAVEVAAAMQNWYATGHVTLEEPVYNFGEFQKGLVRKPGPKRAVMREGGRVDLALWKKGHGGDFLIGAIEAKRNWTNGEVLKDISRLRELKDRYGKICKGELQYTAFVSFLSTSNDPDGKCMDNFYEKIETWVEENIDPLGKMRVSFAKRRHFLECEDFEGNELVYCGSVAVIEVI